LSTAALSTFGCLILIASSLPGVLRRDADLPAALLFYAYCVSFACGYALAISWPFFEYMAFPALGVVLAAVSVRRPDLLRPPYRRWAVGFVVLILFTAIYQKVNTPFFWAGWCEPPPWSANAKSKLPQLEGFVLSKDTADFFDDVTDLIRKHSARVPAHADLLRLERAPGGHSEPGALDRRLPGQRGTGRRRADPGKAPGRDRRHGNPRRADEIG
jgi:hypothetical protein